MLDRRVLLTLALSAGGLAASREAAAQAPATSDRTGFWDVVETMWAAPGAAPRIVPGRLVAERRMVGTLLTETLRADDAVQRLDFLTYKHDEGRWDYVSFDTRDPAGLMSAWSFTRGDADRIDLAFAPFAFDFPGAPGQMLRMEQSIIRLSPGTERKDQYFIRADGTGVRWLGHRYDYRRRA